jgi:acetate kinase
MGTRSGDIDPSVIFYLVDELGYDIEEVRSLLNRQSGMLGLTGKSDMRDISAAIDAGDPGSELALEMYAYRIKKYIGSYAAVLNGLDAIVFTAGVGENAANVRASVCKNFDFFGASIDPVKNAVRSVEIREINIADSKVKILVIPTNEELEIAQQCYQLLNSDKGSI